MASAKPDFQPDFASLLEDIKNFYSTKDPNKVAEEKSKREKLLQMFKLSEIDALCTSNVNLLSFQDEQNRITIARDKALANQQRLEKAISELQIEIAKLEKEKAEEENKKSTKDFSADKLSVLEDHLVAKKAIINQYQKRRTLCLEDLSKHEAALKKGKEYAAEYSAAVDRLSKKFDAR